MAGWVLFLSEIRLFLQKSLLSRHKNPTQNKKLGFIFCTGKILQVTITKISVRAQVGVRQINRSREECVGKYDMNDSHWHSGIELKQDS